MSTVSNANTATSRLSRRRWLTLAAAAGGAIVASATHTATAAASSLTPAGATAAAPAVVKSPASAQGSSSQIMNWFAQSSQGGFFNATKNGYYSDLGYNVSMSQGGPGISVIPLVATGTHTFGMTSADSVLLARQEGIPVVMVFGTFQVNPQGLMYHMTNPVNDFPELSGRKVYVSAPGTYWTVISAKYNLTDVQQFAYNGQTATFLADDTNVFQCFVSSEPVILKKQGYDVGYLLNADSGFNPYNNAIVCTEATLKSQPDLVQAYVTASLKGWVEYMSDPNPTLEYIKSEFNKDYDLTIAPDIYAVEKNMLITGRNGYDPSQLGLLTSERFSELYQLMRGTNIIKQDMDYSSAFDASFITNAHAALGI